MKTSRILLLPGDGIGTEVMAATRRVIDWIESRGLGAFSLEEGLVGGASIDDSGKPVSDETLNLAKQADAVLFGAAGGPDWDDVPFDVRPEAGLMRLRKELDLFSNLRPARVYSALTEASSLRAEVVSSLDILIVRELTGGVYFAEPKELVVLEDGLRRAVDSQVYHEAEITRVARRAFDVARERRSHVTSVEKRNVMKTGVLWNAVVRETHRNYSPDIKLDHMLADNCAMQLVRQPTQFDVILTDNLFGDILSDIAAALTGSIGLLPSASLGSKVHASEGETQGNALYEPVHGSAPDIAGKQLANPVAMIASFAMALRYSLAQPDLANIVERAIEEVLNEGARTTDIARTEEPTLSTGQMVSRILDKLEVLASSTT